MNKHKASFDRTQEQALLHSLGRWCRFDLYNRVMLITLLILSGWSFAQAQYGLVDGVAYLSAALTRGQTASFTTRFQAGVEYLLTATGAGSSADVDLEVLSASGVVVASDISYNKAAMFTFKPAVSGQYTVRLKLAQGSGIVVCGVMISREGGWDVPISNMLTVLEKGMDFVYVLTLAGLATDTQVSYPTGDWSCYAGVLRVGEELGVSNIY
ncbi:MAG: hypothetical protein SNJ72_07695, partial [Fimbriimonadales bacterium]